MARTRPPSPPSAGAQPNRAETPIAFIRAMVQAYERRGLSAAHALTKAQIPPQLLQQDDARVTALQMEWMSETAMRELDDEALGWFDRRLPWGSYGMLVRASLSAPNLGVALVRWCRHHGLLTDHIGLRLQRDGAQAHLTLTEHRPLHNAQHQWQEFCVVSVLRNAMGVAQWLIDSQLRLHQVQLAFAPPAHASAYAVLFDGPVRFDAPEHRLSFDAGYLGLPIKRDEAALQRMLQRALLLTVRPYRRDRLLRERVRALLLGGQGGPGPAATAADLAEALHVSERTLHRQLKDEGASLQAIKDDVRRQRAQDLLQRSRKPIKHIAAEVGFGSEKSFIRAFRGWTGQTPDGYRQGQLSND